MKFFSFFSFFPFPQRAVTGCFPPNGSKHDSGCIHLLRVFHGFPGKKNFSFYTMSGNIVVSRHWRIFSAHPIVCVQSVFSFFCPRGTVQRADSTGGKQGFLQMPFSYRKFLRAAQACCKAGLRVDENLAVFPGYSSAWTMFFRLFSQEIPCIFPSPCAILLLDA